MHVITVNASEFSQWRNISRELLKRDISPEYIVWQDPTLTQSSLDLFQDTSNSHERNNNNFETDLSNIPVTTPKPSISAETLEAIELASCYRDDTRWALFYAIVWRVIHEDKQLLENITDNQIMRLNHMQKSVGRDIHKMHAFVRFQKISDSDHYVAWFEPEHLILKKTSSFFKNRFKNMTWSILTPDGGMHWDQQSLFYTEPSSERPVINDELESLWLEYYRNIFNPARLKLKAMQSEMPKKYWKNLPEAPLIKSLSRESAARAEAMIEKNNQSISDKKLGKQMASIQKKFPTKTD